MDDMFRKHYEWAIRVARRVLGNTHDAEDAVSEVFTSTLKAVQKGKGPRDNVRAYLRRAIQNEATRFYARRRLETPTDEVPEVPIPDRTPDVGRAIDRAQLLRLCPTAWPLLLFHVDVCGLSAKEASVELGITEYAAVSALHRARKALRLAA